MSRRDTEPSASSLWLTPFSDIALYLDRGIQNLYVDMWVAILSNYPVFRIGPDNDGNTHRSFISLRISNSRGKLLHLIQPGYKYKY
jgi:hypothetical protein